jgi:hypothetical protein
VEFGRDLSEIQAIYQDTGQKTKKKDAAPYVPHIAVSGLKPREEFFRFS